MKTGNYIKGLIAGMVLSMVPAMASAQDKVRVGYMKIPPLVHIIHGLEAGIFQRNGIDLDLTVLNGGPELMTALASRSIDIGMTASGIVLIARAKGLKLKAFGTSDSEKSDDKRNWIIADANDGITTLADLVGKTVGIVAKKSPAELTVRDHMLKAGLDVSTVKFVALPFPQLPSALEVGNVDAIVVVEPFHTQIMHSDKVKAVELAEGLIATVDEDGEVSLGGWFAGDEWLADEANQDIAARFLKSVLESNRELMADRNLVNAIFERDFGMPPPVAKRVPLPLRIDDLIARPEDFQPTIRAFARTGMISKEYPAQEAVQTITYD